MALSAPGLPLGTCALCNELFGFWEIYMSSQVPAPSTAAWLLDLAAVRGPRFVVLRGDEGQARVALAEALVDNGKVWTIQEAEELIADAVSEPIGVVW